MFIRKSMEDLGRKSAAESKSGDRLPVILILDDVRSMHNVGSAFRTADAFGAEAVYLCGFTPAPPHRDIRKTALGAEESVPWIHFPGVADALDAARYRGYRIIAVEQVQESTSLAGFPHAEGMPLALVFGNEVDGVSDEVLEAADACIEIPQSGAKHSLNISVAIGVVLWELVRTLPLSSEKK